MQELHLSIDEAKQAIEDPASRVRAIGTAFELEREILAADSDLLPESQMRTLRLSGYLIKILREHIEPIEPRRRRSYTRLEDFAPIELHYIAEGVSRQQSADARQMAVFTVRDRTSKLNHELGIRTHAQLIAEAIKRGYVPLNLELAEYEMLSPRERTVLDLAACGWNVNEIADYLNIRPKTVDTYYEEVRRKLDARTIGHCVKRAYELGIYSLGQPIESPAERGAVMVSVLNQENQPVDSLETQDPLEIELLSLLKDRGGILYAHDILQTDFFASGNPEARLGVFGSVIVKLMAKLKTPDGQPVIQKRKVRLSGKRIARYEFRHPLLVQDCVNTFTIEAYEGSPLPEAPKPRPRRQSKKKSVARRSQPQLSKTNKEPEIEIQAMAIEEQAESEIVEEIVHPPEECSSDELVDLDQAIINLRRRKESEIESKARQAMYQVARDSYLSYREKLVLALRYGVSFSALGLGSINRPNSDRVPVEKLRLALPIDNVGLKLESASELSGLTPYGILVAEEAVLSRHAHNYAALNVRLAAIQVKKKTLEETYAQAS